MTPSSDHARRTLRQRLDAWLDLGIPPGAVGPAVMRRIRTVSTVTFTMIWVAVVVLAQSLWMGRTDVFAYLSVATLAGIANLALLRRTRDPNLSGHVAVGILTVLIALSALSSGGFYDPNFGWFYILPLAAAVVVELRGAAIWTGVTVTLTGVFWALPELGIHVPNQTDPEWVKASALAGRILTIGAIGAIGAGFVIGQRRTGQELERETTYLELAMHAAVAANQARSFEGALREAVERICQAMDFTAGHVLTVGDDGACRSTGIVCSQLPDDSELVRLSLSRTFAPGDGLPGRAVASGKPELVSHVAWRHGEGSLPSKLRGRAADSLGLAAAFAVPVLVQGRARAVLEFASPHPLPDPERLLEVFTHIGVQLGRVAERTAWQERIRQTQKMEAVGQLAAGLAHEINNPMSFVRSNLHSLRELSQEEKESLDAEDFQALIDESLDGVERTISIVRDVMQFSRLGDGDPAAWGLEDVNELLRDSLRVGSTDVPAGVDFVVETSPLPRLRCAANGLRQVFLNLIVNAVQAVGEQGRVQISTRQEGRELVVRVADDGPGLRPGDRERLFDPFFTTKPVGQGTGLGLTVSYEIVQGHGGSLRVESEPGCGATFEVRLPLEAAEDAEAAP